MKSELLDKLESLLEAENPLEALKEFNRISAELRSTTKPKVADKENESEQEGAPVNNGENHKEAAAKARPAPKAESTPTAIAEPAASRDEVKAGESSSDEPSAETAEAVQAVAEGGAETMAVKADVGQEEATASHEAERPSADTIAAAQDEKLEEPEESSAVPSPDQEIPSEQQDVAPEAESLQPSAQNTESDEASDSERSEEDENAEIRSKLKELTDQFREKLAIHRDKQKKIEEETVSTAKGLLEELQELVETEENIGKAFSSFNAIQEKWKSLPKVSNDNYRELNSDYNKSVERFFYNINIYKELKELDLKRNLEEKLLVLEDQKKLLYVNDVRLLEVEVRLNQDRWNEIGPTYREEWDKIKDEFWSITRSVYKKVQEFYNLRKQEQEKNLEEKKALLEKARHIAQLDLRANKKWQEKTKEIKAIQKDWKMVGFVPKDQLGPVWKEFREACDAFFEKKRLHFGEIHETFEAHRLEKEAVLNEAEKWKDSTEWKEATDKFISLQKRWKETGPAHQKDENRLWKKFREACDHFFQLRNAGKDQESKQEAENLDLKNKLLDEIESFEVDPKKSAEGIGTMKAFSERFREIGHVPYKEKDKINKRYRKLMDDKYALLKVDRKEKEKIRFEEKVELMKGTDAKVKLVQKEKDLIRSKISKLESEINQYENNMGFFANSKGAEKLKAEVVKKIEAAKEDVDHLYSQLQVLDEV